MPVRFVRRRRLKFMRRPIRMNASSVLRRIQAWTLTSPSRIPLRFRLFLADDNRRSGLAVTDQHQQGGPEKSKPREVSQDPTKEEHDAAQSDLKELPAVMTRDHRDDFKEAR